MKQIHSPRQEKSASSKLGHASQTSRINRLVDGVALSAGAVWLTLAGLDHHHVVSPGAPILAAEVHGHRLGPVRLAAQTLGAGPAEPQLELLHATAAHVEPSDRSASGLLLGGGIAFPTSLLLLLLLLFFWGGGRKKVNTQTEEQPKNEQSASWGKPNSEA